MTTKRPWRRWEDIRAEAGLPTKPRPGSGDAPARGPVERAAVRTPRGALPGVKVHGHRACPCCGRPIAYVSVPHEGAWRHLHGRARVGDFRCGPLYPGEQPNSQPWISTILREVQAQRRAASRRHERHRERPLVRRMRIPGLPLPELVTVPMDVYVDLQDEAMVLLRAKHELQLHVERLQEQVAELQGQVAELVKR